MCAQFMLCRPPHLSGIESLKFDEKRFGRGVIFPSQKSVLSLPLVYNSMISRCNLAYLQLAIEDGSY